MTVLVVDVVQTWTGIEVASSLGSLLLIEIVELGSVTCEKMWAVNFPWFVTRLDIYNMYLASSLCKHTFCISNPRETRDVCEPRLPRDMASCQVEVK